MLLPMINALHNVLGEMAEQRFKVKSKPLIFGRAPQFAVTISHVVPQAHPAPGKQQQLLLLATVPIASAGTWIPCRRGGEVAPAVTHMGTHCSQQSLSCAVLSAEPAAPGELAQQA